MDIPYHHVPINEVLVWKMVPAAFSASHFVVNRGPVFAVRHRPKADGARLSMLPYDVVSR
jgi:hypothetical protein